MSEPRQNADGTGTSAAALPVSIDTITHAVTSAPPIGIVTVAAPPPETFAPQIDRHILLAVFLI